MPAFASRVASEGPACPAPITIASYVSAMRTTLNQFDQHTARALWMNEDIAMPTRPDFDFVRNQPHSIAFQLCECGLEIRHAQANMMDSLAAFGDELRDRQ